MVFKQSNLKIVIMSKNTFKRFNKINIYLYHHLDANASKTFAKPKNCNAVILYLLSMFEIFK